MNSILFLEAYQEKENKEPIMINTNNIICIWDDSEEGCGVSLMNGKVVFVAESYESMRRKIAGLRNLFID